VRHVEVSLREFLERLVDERFARLDTALAALAKLVEERDRLYISKFDASQRAVDAALVAQKEATATAFSASEKAIVKAEAAQADYNVRSNEFRGQLDDQAKTLMPRLETIGLLAGVTDKFRSVDDKLDQLRKTIDGKLEDQRTANEKAVDVLARELQSLRSIASAGGGRDVAQHEFVQQRNWSTGLLVTAVLAIAAMLVTIAVVLVRSPATITR
jgi:hypothetical protein